MSSQEVKQLRKDFCLSQMALSKEAGVSRYRLCMYENGYGDLNQAEIQNLEQAIQRLVATRFAKFKGAIK